MNVTQVTEAFRLLADEPDSGVLTAEQEAGILSSAYNDFRGYVLSYDAHAYTVFDDIVLAGTDVYDLGDPANPVCIMGPDAVLLNTNGRAPLLGGRAEAIVGVSEQNNSFTIGDLIDSRGSLRSLTAGGGFGVRLMNRALVFSELYTGTIRVFYTLESQVDWSLSAPADNEYIDDMAAFHVLIVMYGVQNYAITDGAVNEPLERKIAQKEAQLHEYLTRRTGERPRYVERISTTRGQ